MANDFSNDSAFIALFNVEDGALGTDSSGNGETLTLSSVVSDVVNFRQGAASAFANLVGNRMYRANASLGADFPGKNGTSNRTFTVCGWVRPTGLLSINYVASIYGSSTNKRTWAIYIDGSGNVNILIGYNGGISAEAFTHTGKTLVNGSWYHISCTYDGTSKDWRIRVKDYTAGTRTESTGTGAQVMNIEDANFALFSKADGGFGMKGNIDELVIFNDVKDITVIDQIADGNYVGIADFWAKILTANPANIATDDYCRITVNDVIGRSYEEVKTDLSLNNVSNVATDDTAYNATSWDANADAATKNAIRDKVETMDTAIGSNTTHRGLTSGNPHSVTPTELSLVIGTNTQAWDAGLDSLAGLTYASDSFIKVTAENTYAIRTIAETKSDLSLNLVENTALSSWAGTASINTLGTIATGTWEATDVGIGYGGTGQSTAQLAINALSAVSGATNEHVLTKDTGTGNAVFKAAAGADSEKVKVDVGATADYIGAANSDGVLRTGVGLSYTDGGNFVTLAYSGLGSAASEYLSLDQSIPTGTITIVEMDTEVYDEGNEHDTGTYRFTATNTGEYLVIIQCKFEVMAAGNACTVYGIVDEGEGTEATVIQKAEIVVANGTHYVSPSKMIHLDAGQTFSVWVHHNNGVAKNIGGGGELVTSYSITRLI
jgi:hypothetical protein